MYDWEEFTVGQKLAWIFSSVSNALWLFVFVPQLYQNYKTQKSVALSLYLLFCLIFGDVYSIISAYTKGLNIVIIYAAVYHIILDLIIIGQAVYYRRKAILLQESEEIEERTSLLNDEDNISTRTNDITFLEYPYLYLSLGEIILITSGIFVSLISCLFVILIKKDAIFIADIVGWLATSIFMLARIPQIILNFKRKSTAGLSLLSFIIINIANMFFLLSILILMYDLKQEEYFNYIKNNIQWIVGSSTTTLFDSIIFYQFYKYKNNNIFESEDD